ncbi:hypothetical protein [Mesobacillus harenae]|uniref:hypothetical protein n=1 Tax=Mesobacillus harenae TaxID=2213203 RepID=UPI00158114E6|nr:hypothetical protein [Mesobacillus harenae]
MDSNEIIGLLREEGIKDPENPTNEELLKLLQLHSNNQLESDLVKNYFQFFSGVIPALTDSLKSFASQHVSKEVIGSLNKRIDMLNREYEKATTPEERDRNHQEIIEIYQMILGESEKQRGFLKSLGYGALGAGIIVGGIAISIKNKEASKKMVTEGLKYIKGDSN